MPAATISLPLVIAVDTAAGRLVPDDWQKRAIHDFLTTLGRKDVAVKFSKPSKARSLNQNAYYWSVVLTAIAEHSGHEAEELHEFFKRKFLPRKFLPVGKEVVEIPKSTTKLNTGEFAAYLTAIIAFAGTELGLGIPPACGL